MTQLPSLKRRNSQKKRTLGLNDRISLKIKAKLSPLDDQGATTDCEGKGTFKDLDQKYAKQRKKRTQLESIQYQSNGTLKLTPPSSSEDTKQRASIHNIQRKVRFLLEKDQSISEFISKHGLNDQAILNEITQPFFMLHLLQGLRNEQQLNVLILKKIKSIHELQKTKNSYQNSQNKMQKMLKNRMKLLQKHLG